MFVKKYRIYDNMTPVQPPPNTFPYFQSKGYTMNNHCSLRMLTQIAPVLHNQVTNLLYVQ